MQEVIGMENANTFMELATPRDWDDVARIHHVGSLRSELTSQMGVMHGQLLTGMHRLAAVQTRWIAGLLGSLVVAMIVALVR
ncbi:MAG: hypothetical protein ACKOQ1_02995 [Actinomycetota bacterium]